MPLKFIQKDGNLGQGHSAWGDVRSEKNRATQIMLRVEAKAQ